MAELWDTTTKQLIDVPDADAPAAVLSGRAGLDASRDVVLFDPDGKSWTMPASSAPQAFEAGYTYGPQTEVASKINEEKFGSFGAKLLAAGANAASGFTMGLSDRALRNLGVSDQTLRDFETGEPLTAGVSKVAGGIASIALTGGAAGVGKGAAAATGLGARGILGRAAAKAIELGTAGAIEGGVFGAGQAVSEDALGRADLNAESLIANAGLGAMVGGGVGGLLGGGASLTGEGLKGVAKYAGEKLGGGSVKEWLEGFAGERALKATLGQQKRAFTQLEDKGLADKAKKYLLEDLGLGKEALSEAAGNTTEIIAGKLAERRDVLQSDLSATVKMLDDVTEGRPMQRVSPRMVADRIKKEVAEPLGRIAADRDTYKALLGEVDAITDLGLGGISFSDARAQRAALQQKVNYDARQGLTAAAEARRKAAQIWNDVIDEHVDPLLKEIDPKAAKTYRDVREEFSLVQRLTDYAENRVQGNAANRFVSPTDYGMGGIAGVMTGDPVTGAVASMAHKTVRERGSAVAANLAYKASRLQFIQKASLDVSKQIDQTVDRFLNGKTRDAVGRFVTPGRPAAQNAQSLASISFLGRAANDNASEIFRVADRKDAAKDRASELAQLVSDPSKAADRIAMSLAGLDEHAPGISGQAALTATKALQFLHAKAPKKPSTINTLQPLLDEWKPSSQEASKFERHVKAALDPLSVLDDLGAGTLTQEAADTLRELYPKLHQMTFEKISAALAHSKKKLPYVDRVNLSLLLGAPVDDSMTPAFITRTQAMFNKPPEGGGGGQQAPAIGKLDLASNMRPATQKLEEKR